MTTNYSEFTNEALRLEVAKRKGWEIVTFPQIASEPYINASMGYGVAPNWPVSIADAWTLVEEMPRLKILKTALGDYHVTYPGDWIVRDRSAPRAICIAWLMWKDEEAG